MVSSKTKAIAISGAGGAGAVVQLVAVKQLVDNTSSIKPLGNFSTPLAKGLNEWSTLISLGLGSIATGYVIYKMEKGEALSDISMALGTYGITSIVGGLTNMFLDPLSSNIGVDLSKVLGKIPEEVSKAFSGIKLPAPAPVSPPAPSSQGIEGFIGRTV